MAHPLSSTHSVDHRTLQVHIHRFGYEEEPGVDNLNKECITIEDQDEFSACTVYELDDCSSVREDPAH